jgi:hypothetical protein
MKFSTFLLSLLASGFVVASPIYQRTIHATKYMSKATGNSVGAVYFITNEPAENFVVSADIAQDGTLTLRQAVSTGGNGSHGVTDPPDGPDPLFSQGAIKSSRDLDIIATVNAGSNTVTLYAIDTADPAQIQVLGQPMFSGGDFPMSVAINVPGNQLCVLNGGAKNGVGCFSIDKQRGLIPQLNNARSLGLNQTTPPQGPAGTTSELIFSEDHKKLIASVKGTPPQPGFFAVWDVSADGSLSSNFTSLPPNTGGLLPFSMTVIRGQNALLATDAGVGFDIVDLADFSQSNRSSVVPIEGQGATCWSAHSEKTGNFYLTDIKTSIVTEVHIDKNLKGSIVKQYAQGNGSGTIDNAIATLPNDDFMYVLSANVTSIDVLSLNAPGQAKHIQRLDLAGPSKSAGLTLTGANLQGMTAYVKKNN